MRQKGLVSKKVIGQHEFSLESIYQRKDHLLSHQWVALTDTSADSSDPTEITGHLKLSIQVTGTKDRAKEIRQDT